jgi:hypothetical protein
LRFVYLLGSGGLKILPLGRSRVKHFDLPDTLRFSGFDRRAVIVGSAIKHRTGGALRLLG